MGLLSAATNHWVIALIIIITYLLMYFLYLKQNAKLLLDFKNDKKVRLVTGNRYSFTNPLRYHLRHG